MRFPRVRFTVRRMMVAVAIGAVSFGVLVDRVSRFRRLCAYYGPRMCTTYGGPKRAWDVFGYKILDYGAYEQELRHNVRMFHKYDFAARYPFLPVSPDPPTPPRSPRGQRDPSYDESRGYGFEPESDGGDSVIPGRPVAPDPPEPE